MCGSCKLIPAKRHAYYHSTLTIRANDEVVTITVHISWPCANEIEVEMRDQHSEGQVEFGPCKNKEINGVSELVTIRAKPITKNANVSCRLTRRDEKTNKEALNSLHAQTNPCPP